MLCRRCLLRLSRGVDRTSLLQQQRALSTTSSNSQPQATAQTTAATNPRPNDLPAATSTAAAQPFSTPLSRSSPREAPASAAQTPRIPSSVPAGIPLRGLNFMKNKNDPIALEDHEYPDWLWTVLERSEADGDGAGSAGGEGDLFSKSKKQRRIAAKALRKQQLLDPSSLVPKVPLEEQTIDLPGGKNSLDETLEAGAARGELTKAMRDRRRKEIKEKNFLKTMK